MDAEEVLRIIAVAASGARRARVALQQDPGMWVPALDCRTAEEWLLRAASTVRERKGGDGGEG